MEYVLGVDHGGTKTHAVIADLKGKIHAFDDDKDFSGRASSDIPNGIKRTVYTINKALQTANLKAEDIKICEVGFCGADWDFEFPYIQEELISKTGIKNILVVNDCIGAMRGGTDNAFGGVVCIGTGLNCSFRNKNGEEFIYGYFVLDKDSGALALGQSVLNAVVEGYTGIGKPSLLEKLVIEQIGHKNIKNVKDLLIAITTGSPEIKQIQFEPKEFAPLLFKAEKMNDKVAKSILDDFAKRVSKYLIAAIKKLKMTKDKFDIVFSGGILKGGDTIMNIIKEQVLPIAPDVKFVQAKYEPVCGLVFMCYEKLLGIPLPKELIDSFDKECKTFNLYRNIGDKK